MTLGGQSLELGLHPVVEPHVGGVDVMKDELLHDVHEAGGDRGVIQSRD